MGSDLSFNQPRRQLIFPVGQRGSMVSMVTDPAESCLPELYAAQAHTADLDARRLQFRRGSPAFSFPPLSYRCHSLLFHALWEPVTQYSRVRVV